MPLAGCGERQQYINLEEAGGGQTLWEAESNRASEISYSSGAFEAEPDDTETGNTISSTEMEQISGYDDRTNDWSTVTWNERYIYTTLQRVNFEAQTYGAFCSVVGCEHNGGNCELELRRTGLRCYEGGVYYVSGNTIYYRTASGTIETVYTNTYSNEYTRKNFPKTDDPADFTSPEMLCRLFFADENTLLVSGWNYFFLYDLLTGQAAEPIDVCESILSTCCLLENVVYSANSNGELYKTDLESGISERVLEQGYNVRAAGGRLWYVKWSDGAAQICSNTLDCSDEVVEIEQASPAFDVCEAGILYYSADYKKLLLYTAEGIEITIAEIDDFRYQNGKEGYTYGDPGAGDMFAYIDDTLYIGVLFQGYSEAASHSEFVIVWYSVKDGVITEFTEE